jgi:predicted chitinase
MSHGNRRSEQHMTNLFTKIYNFENPHAQILPTPDGSETQSGASTQSNGASLQPIKNWSHPFRDKRDPFSQLAHLAKAAGGGYPLGGNGLWHGGVHFDGGTAGTVDQSSVHCLADGEVVAYRVDEQSPTTPYFFNKMAVNKPFSRNFVLVRHRLQPPKIEGNPDSPPSLVFYSLYMHLQDWAVYHADATIARPGFWAAGSSLHVKDDVADLHVDHPGQKGLNVRNQARKGKIVGWLPRGAEVTVTGNGDFRKLENTLGPDALIAANGSLKGYVSARYLSAISDGQHRIQCKNILNVRAEASQHSDIIFELPAGTEVTVSGQGAYRKLERINQYVHYKSLRGGAAEPQTCDSVVVLGKPVAIKAGDLIGHIGEHQEGNAERPENRLHLEVFSGDDVEMFFKLSALWAARMPASGKTWLKLVEGTPVVTHQASFTSKQPPTLKAASRPSAAQLLVPKSLLDGLPADWKIAVAASGDTKACNWYRLDGLLHDDTNTLLDGWVCEEVGVTPWVSPWSWEGYVALFNYDSPRNMMASFKRAVGLMKEEELTRYGGMADSVDKGPIKNRLYDIIDRNKDGHITAAEVQGALMLPAHAQSLSQLIVYYESEWRHTPHKWDELDELLGHSGSTPNKNWLAEKERIKQTSWWGDVASQVGLPAHGKVYHMHPLSWANSFIGGSELIFVDEFLAIYEVEHREFAAGTRMLSQSSKANLRKIIVAINKYYEDFAGDANIYEVSYMLATARHEAYHFPTGEFFSEEPEVGSRSYFNKYDPVLAADPQKRERAVKNGNTVEGDGLKFRGRGCVHLTWKNNYQKFSDLLSYDFVSDPDAAARFEYAIPIMIIGMTQGSFTGKKLHDYFGGGMKDYASARKIINGVDKKDLIASYAERFEKILKRTSILGAGVQ